jgi:hypothetical protein
VDGIVGVELLHRAEHRKSVFRLVQDQVGELDACVRGRLGLHADVGRRVGPAALLDDGQVRLEARVLLLDRADPLVDRLPDDPAPSIDTGP